MQSNKNISPGKLHYLALKDASKTKGNLFITSYLIKNERGNYIIDFDDNNCSWILFKPTDIEMNELKNNYPKTFNQYKKYQKRKEITPIDFEKFFEILSVVKS